MIRKLNNLENLKNLPIILLLAIVLVSLTWVQASAAHTTVTLDETLLAVDTTYGNDTGETPHSMLDSGTAHFTVDSSTGKGTLTLTDAVIKGEVLGNLITVSGHLNIELVGENRIEVFPSDYYDNGKTAIWSDDVITITGQGSLTVIGGSGFSGEEGFYNDGTVGGTAIEGNLVIESGTLVAKGGDGGDGYMTNDGAAGAVAIDGSVTVNDGTLVAMGGIGGSGKDGDADAKQADGMAFSEKPTISGSGSLDIQTAASYTANNGEFSPNSSTVVDEGTNYHESVYVSIGAPAPAPQVYPVSVAGIQITDQNKGDVLGSSDSGNTVTYTPAGGNNPATLTLNGATISPEGKEAGIETAENLDIVAVANTVNTIRGGVSTAAISAVTYDNSHNELERYKVSFLGEGSIEVLAGEGFNNGGNAHTIIGDVYTKVNNLSIYGGEGSSGFNTGIQGSLEAHGGTVYIQGGDAFSAHGSSAVSNGVTIFDGTVTLKGGIGGETFSGGAHSHEGTLTLHGGTLKATGGHDENSVYKTALPQNPIISSSSTVTYKGTNTFDNQGNPTAITDITSEQLLTMAHVEISIAKDNEGSNSGSNGSGGGSSISTPSNEIDSGREVNVSKIEDIFEDGDDLVIDGDDSMEAVFDTDAIKAILDGAGEDSEGIEIIIEEASDSMLNDKQKATVGDRPVFNLQVLIDGEAITDFDGGQVSITVPYELKDGETAENLVIYYLDDEGNVVKKIDVEYDEDEKEITFKLDHFSIYMLAYEEDVEETVNPFADVKSSDWFYDSVMYAYEKQLMSGVSETTFAPQGTATRAMIATVLWNMEENPVVNYAHMFEDVEEGMWYTEAVRWAVAEGIVSGTTETTYSPDTPITRQEFAAMLYRYEQYKGGGFTGTWAFPLEFVDAEDVSEWAYEAMAYMTMNDIITGKDGNILDPKGTATRAEIATILMRYEEQ